MEARAVATLRHASPRTRNLRSISMAMKPHWLPRPIVARPATILTPGRHPTLCRTANALTLWRFLSLMHFCMGRIQRPRRGGIASASDTLASAEQSAQDGPSQADDDAEPRQGCGPFRGGPLKDVSDWLR